MLHYAIATSEGLDISVVGGKVLKAEFSQFDEHTVLSFSKLSNICEVWKVKEGLVNEWNKKQPEELQAL